MTKINETLKENTIGVIESPENIRIKAQFNAHVVWKSLLTLSFAVILFAVLFMGKMSYGIFSAFCVVSLVISIVGLVICKGSENLEFYVTKEYVYSKTIFGNVRIIPVENIALIRFSFLSSMHLATKDVAVSSYYIKNRKEISSVINKLAREK